MKAAFERDVQGLVGLTVNAVDYWGVHNFSDEPAGWDYGDWHQAVMGVQLGTTAGPVTIIWTNRFYPYGVEAFRKPIEQFFMAGDEGPLRVGPTGPSAWDQFLGHRITGAATNWGTIGFGPATRDGRVVEPARDVELPTAIRLDFDAGSVWFVAAISQWPEMDEVFIPGDEIIVVFSRETLRSMGLATKG